MSIFLNIASAVLIIPIVILAVFFLFIDVLAGGTFAGLLDALLAMLRFLPDPDDPKAVFAAALPTMAVLAGGIYLMIRISFLFPLTVFLLGLGSLGCVILDASTGPEPDNFLLWVGVVGVVLAAVQFRRALVPRVRAVKA